MSDKKKNVRLSVRVDADVEAEVKKISEIKKQSDSETIRELLVKALGMKVENEPDLQSAINEINQKLTYLEYQKVISFNQHLNDEMKARAAEYKENRLNIILSEKKPVEKSTCDLVREYEDDMRREIQEYNDKLTRNNDDYDWAKHI